MAARFYFDLYGVFHVNVLVCFYLDRGVSGFWTAVCMFGTCKNNLLYTCRSGYFLQTNVPKCFLVKKKIIYLQVYKSVERFIAGLKEMILAPERPSYPPPPPPPLFMLLNQMVPSFLAVPRHLALQPTAVWDSEPCRWFIILTEGALGPDISSAPSQDPPPPPYLSALLQSPACQPRPPSACYSLTVTQNFTPDTIFSAAF